ncbi:hypothetical protein SH661x_000960 [Planctomicrobium sp. SH661]|uniref:hypothetical protein n=1 Tax=Planctomicrobium sp. SH661 TaxID=3448124 RepID=UPI003F5C68D0
MEQKSQVRKTIRIINRLGISSLFLGIAAALIRAWVTHWLGPTSGPAVAPTQTAMIVEEKLQTVEDLLSTSPVSLMEWQSNVEQRYDSAAQRERAFRNYIGKQVVWEGYFDQFNLVAEPRDEQSAGVLIMQESHAALFEKRLLGPPSVRCFLPKSAAASLSQLEKGDWVVVRGRLGDPKMAGNLLCTDLSECEVIASSHVRAVETVLGSGETITR